MRVEKISFEEVVPVSDGAGGSTGEQEVKYTCMAEYEALKPSRLLEAAQARLQQGYRFIIWITSLYEPKTGSTIRFLDERLTIQGYRYYDEARTRYEITAIEQANTQSNGIS